MGIFTNEIKKRVITVTKLGALKEGNYKTKKLRRKKRFILTQKKISKNITKTLRLTMKRRGFLLQYQQREQDSKQVGIHIR